MCFTERLNIRYLFNEFFAFKSPAYDLVFVAVNVKGAQRDLDRGARNQETHVTSSQIRKKESKYAPVTIGASFHGLET